MYATTQPLPSEDNLLQLPETFSWTHDEVREELDRILSSRFFVKSERLSSFLRTAVSYLLDGRGDRFKEYTVGIEVYKRPASYDPTQDSIVRTEARRLRAKLKEYYASSPVRSSIMILVSAGSYIPVIRSRADGDLRECSEAESYFPLAGRGEALCIGVFPFNSRSSDLPALTLACDLERELTHELVQQSEMKVFRVPSGISPDPFEYRRLWNRSGVQLVIEGYISLCPDGAIVHVQITNLSGMIVWSGRFDCELLSVRYRDISSKVLDAVLGSIGLQSQSACITSASSPKMN
ncbi:MAG: hypothetical protein WBY53_20040 [Acidobacteriaceae bacterium]